MKNQVGNNLIVINSYYMDNNTYLLSNNNEVLIIDPSFSGDEVLKSINKNEKVVGVILTHAHFDHCFDTAKILAKWNVPVYIHEGDKDTYSNFRYEQLTDMKVIDFSKNIKWFNTKSLSIGSFKIDVIHTPGHSSGSVCYRYQNFVFVGDTLFYNSYGRTDLGNSSPTDMVKSLNYLWKILKDDDLILPGHSKYGSFKDVKRDNYMVRSLIQK